MPNTRDFHFEISLSVLNHLGRNLYRSFETVIGEAISNAWDADAENIQIYLDKKRNSFIIKDDGIGMTAEDFQNKFLKIGYSKRKSGNLSPVKRRRFIGRKGIGKLALLSCADKIMVISKTRDGEYIGGVIDNTGLDRAITDDLIPREYQLGKCNLDMFGNYIKGHRKGTVIYFKNVKDGIKHSLAFLKKIIALYFRFSLLDHTFKIFIDGERVTQECLNDLAKNTQYLWKINNLDDPYIQMLRKMFTSEENEEKQFNINSKISGFIASVKKPRDLIITNTEERVGVDLFVNGRLREKDILRHIPTARVVESYLYGQIHYNDLDDDIDRFATSREGVVADDPKFKELLSVLQENIMGKILQDWDTWRRKHRKEGDPENRSITKKDRKAQELYNVVSDEYSLPRGSQNKKKVDGWVGDLSSDAAYNFASYADCFISENIIRKYITAENITLSDEAKSTIAEFKRREKDNKTAGNINIDIRQSNTETSYLDMPSLANLVDKVKTSNCLPHDAKQYKPIRDALMHTALLTEAAKRKLTTVYENIRDRIKTLVR